MLAKQTHQKLMIEEMAIETAIKEGYDKEGRVADPNDAYYGKLEEFAIHNCTFFECNNCEKPYFGGMQDCQQAMASEGNMKKEDLLCQDCAKEALGFGKDFCEKHGNEFIDFKCKYCCSIALFFCCGGNEHFCTPCHNDAMNGGKHGAKTEC